MQLRPPSCPSPCPTYIIVDPEGADNPLYESDSEKANYDDDRDAFTQTHLYSNQIKDLAARLSSQLDTGNSSIEGDFELKMGELGILEIRYVWMYRIFGVVLCSKAAFSLLQSTGRTSMDSYGDPKRLALNSKSQLMVCASFLIFAFFKILFKYDIR